MSDRTPDPAAKTSRGETPAPDGVGDRVGDTNEPARPLASEQTQVLSESSPETVSDNPAQSESTPSHQVVYVNTPHPPKKHGNRGIGTLIALASAVLFTALLALGTATLRVFAGDRFGFEFLGRADFYVPVLFFAIGAVALVLIVNRAGWWSYILGSLLVAVLVYFGTIGVGLLGTGIIMNTPAEAAARYAQELGNPFVIVSALLAREVSIWVGAVSSARGRRVTARNAVMRDAFDREHSASERGAAPTAI